jgi:hypothetical protein
MEKYCTARHATDSSIWGTRVTCWIIRLDTLIICNIPLPLLLFRGKNGYMNVPQCYLIRILPTFLTCDFENVLVDFSMVRRSFQFRLLGKAKGKAVQQDCSDICILKDWMAHYR